MPDAVRALGDAVRALRMMDADVVVGTCPDMGAIQPIQPPLKWLAHRWSRQLAALQTVAVVEAGGRTVSLGDLLGPSFAADPERMFAWDRFHPSADGYAAAAAVLLPSMVSALAEPAGPRPAEPDGAGVRNLYAAAAKAAEQSGTEVAPATVAGRERGPRRSLGTPTTSGLAIRRTPDGSGARTLGAWEVFNHGRGQGSGSSTAERAGDNRAIRQLSRAAAVTALAGAVGGMALLAAETLAARTRRYASPDMQLAMRATVGPAKAPTLRLVLLGDSTALGVGVDQVADTVGGQLAALLAEGPGGRRVELSSVAVAGSHSSDLGIQVARALVGQRPDVAVILIGTNDAVRLARPARRPTSSPPPCAGCATRAPRWSSAPAPTWAPPARSPSRCASCVGWHGRRLGRAQVEAVRAAGGVPVDLAERTGPVFRADAGTLCHDGFHPSADGYRVWAHALLPAGGRGGGGLRST